MPSRCCALVWTQANAPKMVESRRGAVAHRAPFPRPAHRTGRADFPHPALGEGFDHVRHTEFSFLRRRARRVPNRLTHGEVVALGGQWSRAPLILLPPLLQLRPLPSAVVTRFIGTMGRSDIPCDPAHALAGRRLRIAPHRLGLPVLMLDSLHACRRLYPGGTVRSMSSTGAMPALRSDGGGLPHYVAGSASASTVSGPQWRFTFVPACMFAELLNSPFRRELQPSGCPRGCLDCYRVQ